ncbi:hypothetical protein COF09_31470 [Bacillus toyonensis]|uniref:hypothetical protein n=1 Tax=Bacillus toyonensis TaxID=155322 RepID=UPI000BFBE305|nr:hypothetical protein [Bacillus toyonensis]PHC35172.1 hypothetical protein COF09_31470 [Bacillus toyonensis]
MYETQSSEDFSGEEVVSTKFISKHQIAFQCMMLIPIGFQINKSLPPKIIYDVSRLSMTKEIAKKQADLEDFGKIEVDLNALIIKGCLSYIINIPIEPINSENIYSIDKRDTSIYLSFQETCYVDHVLKYSVDQLPYYIVDDDHIQVRDLYIKLIKENPQTAEVSGVFYLNYD